MELGDVKQSETEIPSYEESVPFTENYTRFSIQLDRLDVRISFRRWLEGRGWLEEVFIDGAKGILDKRWVRAIEGFGFLGIEKCSLIDNSAIRLPSIQRHSLVRKCTAFKGFLVVLRFNVS